jgi:hypothetical protein
MSLTRDDILEYAAPYLTDDDTREFILPGDLFCMVTRTLPEDKIVGENEGWRFAAYGVCMRYLLDEEAKPAGKWIWFEFISLNTFPPQLTVLKLQPPHIVRGRFQSPARSEEYRLFPLPTSVDRLPHAILDMLDSLGMTPPGGDNDKPDEEPPDNSVKFPGRKD